jgi:branched-chain amino acid transport system substrate-binding protein
LKTSRMAASGCLVAAMALGAAACGGGSDSSGGSGSSSGGGGGAAKTLNVYSSLPLQGASRAQTEALNNGAQLALEQHGGKAGNFKINFIKLDDSTAQAGAWTPEATQANARKVAQDDNAAAYIGEFNSGASAVSIPILNEGGVPQISPANTAVGLTTDDAGAAPGEPGKYYPAGTRTYARIVPKDTIQGAALVTLMKQDGCTKVAMTNDKEVYGAGLAKNIELAAKSQGLDIISNDAIDKNAANYRSLAQKAKSGGADCFVFAGITANGAVQQFKDFGAALPSAKMYGPDGICESGFTDPKKGGIPTSLDPRFKCTVATLDPSSYPPDGKQFFKEYTQKYGDKHPDPYAIYGYEAMNLALDAIQRSQSGSKEDILKALFATKDRKSVLGTYSIDQNGDTTLTDYGVYSVKNGTLEFDQKIQAKAAG